MAPSRRGKQWVAIAASWPLRWIAAPSNRQPTGSGSSSFDIIVEDDPTLQRLYKLTMEKWGPPLHLRLADNGFDGLVQVGKAVPNILIADLMMPGMDGFGNDSPSAPTPNWPAWTSLWSAPWARRKKKQAACRKT